MAHMKASAIEGMSENQKKTLFWACFAALIATSFGFIIRALLIDTWGAQFNLTEVQKGEIFGAGLWPFAISIILFSLIIDRIGYGTAMAFAFVCHIASVVLTVTATGYTQLYWAMFICALANGTVEAVINPVVATLFPTAKVRWLNILHAGWPGGLVLGGILTIALADVAKTGDWRVVVGIIAVPMVVYLAMLTFAKFPINEREQAGVSYKTMLAELGGFGALVA